MTAGWNHVTLLLLTSLASTEAHALSLSRLTDAQQWARIEFRIDGVPQVSNPFDPAVVSVDALFTTPSGRQVRVPGFWHRAYQRSLQNGKEQLGPVGVGQWRIRFTPPEAGTHGVSVTVHTNGHSLGSPLESSFDALPAPAGGGATGKGYVRIAPNNRFFETSEGSPLPLAGANVCWYGQRGTFDYDLWFPHMGQAKANFARIWMAPWAFGIEAEPGTLTSYRLDRAWQLDYILELAERNGVYLMLCLDYHGMYEVETDYWGGGDYWPRNPYNVAQGGPSANQDAFFTNSQAKAAYQKRLRYLIARYGYSQNLLAWEFFNELDNVYRYLDASHVASWHAEMGGWLRANDPYRHLVTTSMTGGSDRPEIWRLPQMDFSMYHSYNLPQPAASLPGIVHGFLDRYQKPMMVGEYGTDWRGWRREQDPFLRGFRQGIWAGALAGSVGISMSWWWETIESENLYSTYRPFDQVFKPAGWGKGQWEPLAFQVSGDPPPRLGDAVPGGQPFNATLLLNQAWGPKLKGEMALATPLSGMLAGSALNSFVHGTAHADLLIPFKVEARLGPNARMVMHLNSVSGGAIMTVRVDGAQVLRRSLPNKDGGWQVNNEYNEDIAVSLAEGKHLIEIRNVGVDWFFLDWVAFENVLPSEYEGGWKPSPVSVGLRQGSKALLYVVSPQVNFPANATNQVVEPLRGGAVTINGMPAGRYAAKWHDPLTCASLATTTASSDGASMVLPLPDFSEDLAGHVIPLPAFNSQSSTWSPAGQFEASLTCASGIWPVIESTENLSDWSPLLTLTNETGTVSFTDAAAKSAHRFYRAKLPQ